MKELSLQSFVRVRRYRSYKGNYGKVAPNILKRDFKANKPNLKWVTDITQFNVLNTKIYLSPIVDLFNGEVISYNISESPNFHQIEDMLDKAFTKIPDNTNLILHSDQGWQYQMEKYQKLLNEKGITQSMLRNLLFLTLYLLLHLLYLLYIYYLQNNLMFLRLNIKSLQVLIFLYLLVLHLIKFLLVSIVLLIFVLSYFLHLLSPYVQFCGF